MPVPYLTVDQVRAAEAELFTRTAPGEPMRRAAHGLSTHLARELRDRVGGVYGRAVGLLVGSGDNGGDALWAGAFLRRRGVRVFAVLLNPAKAHAGGLAALRAAGGTVVEALPGVDLVVDGIVGIAGKGALRPDAAAHVAAAACPVVAVDLPSGVDPDTGAVDGPCVRAALTVTFGAYKPVHALAAPYCGRVELVPIGLDLPATTLNALGDGDVRALWPLPGPADDKYTQGVVGVVAGSSTYPGAAVLCASGAVTATSGMVRYAGTAARDVVAALPEVVAAPSVALAGRVQAWVVGPGMGLDTQAARTLREVLAQQVPTLVDADGLTLLSRDPAVLRERTAPTLLTPHAGEFARLAGAAPGPDRVAAARALARDWGVTVLLKGRATVVAAPDGQVLLNEAGGSWAATAGSGDVLAGMTGALLASGLDPLTAAGLGARVHAQAAARAAHGDGPGVAPVSASALVAAVRPALRAVLV